ncbi:MAG: hypothetical protein ACK40S_01550 [Burkholderiaceae bacterium]
MAQRECFLPLSSRMALAMLKGAGISGGKPVSCTLELDTSALPHLVVKFAVLPDELAAVLAELGALREVGERAEAGRVVRPVVLLREGEGIKPTVFADLSGPSEKSPEAFPGHGAAASGEA